MAINSELDFSPSFSALSHCEYGGLAMLFDKNYMKDPHPVFSVLREQARAVQILTPKGKQAWFVGRYSDVRKLLLDPRMSIDRRNAGVGRGRNFPPSMNSSLVDLDPPEHTRLRKLVSGTFNAESVNRIKKRTAEISASLLEEIFKKGGGDLVREYAMPLPALVISEILGFSAQDRESFFEWSSVLFRGVDGPEFRNTISALMEFIDLQIKRKRKEPDDDLLTKLVSISKMPGRLSEEELTSMASLILFAGFENVANSICLGVLALLRNSEQHSLLRDNPRLIGAAVSEVFRFDPPGQFAVRRFPTEVIELDGIELSPGDTVLLGISSGNRDPRRFSHPDRFWIDRPDSGYLSLGYGPHACLGAMIAKSELEIALRDLTQRFSRIALSVPEDLLTWRDSYNSRGVVELPISFH
ncbi:cytochrome P450 [Streptomyces sp. NPDC088354]|uniref:cytochrome P450 family protein n=1 Tax=Streptomyces sp. NPDC088354 TaxID=3365856 RepID=UPI0038266ADA